MLKGEYTREELGVKRGNIQWKVKVNDETLLFVNEGNNNKPELNYIYSNHLDREANILYMCRNCGGDWIKKLLKDINETNVKINYNKLITININKISNYIHILLILSILSLLTFF